MKKQYVSHLFQTDVLYQFIEFIVITSKQINNNLKGTSVEQKAVLQGTWQTKENMYLFFFFFPSHSKSHF